MGSIWTVPPDTTRVEGEWDGHAFWLEVKRQLNEGERRKLMTAGFRGVSGQGAAQRPGRVGEEPKPTEITIDWTVQSYTRTLTYVTDWSLTDDKGNKLARTRDTLEALHPDAYAAIEGVINAHVERSEQEKKVTAGDSGPRAISA